MKKTLLLVGVLGVAFFVVALLVGQLRLNDQAFKQPIEIDDTGDDNLANQSSNPRLGHRRSEEDFERAVETIATSADMKAAKLADATLRDGGLDAIRVLRRHLKDPRDPPSGYLTRAVVGRVSMGTHCFWLIQDMIEPRVGKLLRENYGSLSPENVESWLDARLDKSLRELQIDSIKQSQERARKDKENPESAVAVQIYARHLEKLEATNSQ